MKGDSTIIYNYFSKAKRMCDHQNAECRFIIIGCWNIKQRKKNQNFNLRKMFYVCNDRTCAHSSDKKALKLLFLKIFAS